MGRGFIGGLLSGTAVSALMLGAVSLATPFPVMPPVEAVAEAAPEAVAETLPDAAPEPAAESVPEPAAAPVADSAPAAAATPADTDAAPEADVVEVPAGSEFARPKPEEDAVLPQADPSRTAAEVPAVTAPEAEPAPVVGEISAGAAPEGQATAPKAPASPEAAEGAMDVPATEGTVETATTDASGGSLSTSATDAAPTAPAAAPPIAAPEEPVAAAPDSGAAAETATDTPSETTPETTPEAAGDDVLAQAEPEAVPEPAPLPEPDPTPLPQITENEAAPPEAAAEAPADAPAATADAAPVEPGDLPPIIVADAPEPPLGVADAPQPGFKSSSGFKSVPGVKVNRLPTIGGDAPAEATTEAAMPAPPDAGTEAAPLPQITAEGTETAAIRRFGAAFDNPDSKPLLAVVIIDLGEAAGGLDPETLSTIAYPVTIAIDPAQPDASARAEMYRQAGFEVAILAGSMPEGATAADLEVAYQSYRGTLPEAALFLGTEAAAFQTNRQAADHVVAMLKPDGMGLLSYAKGLNPASSIAAEQDLPHGEIYRVIDGNGERSETIRRALDRAAFEAVQSGQVVVLAQSLPETITAFFGWAAESAGAVAIAPASAVALKAVGG